LKCPKCNAEIMPGWKVCPECAERLPSAAAGESEPRPPEGGTPNESRANIALEGSVVKDVSQQASGPGGASVSAKDSVVRSIEQKAEGDPASGEGGTGLDALRGLAGVHVTEGVVKEIHQTVNVYLGEAAAADVLRGRRAAGLPKARMIYAACGNEIRAFNPRAESSGSEPANVYTLPSDMGSARSVRWARVGDRVWILAGTRRGVVAFDAETAEARTFPFETVTSHGANAVEVLGDYVYASHSDLGLIRWPIVGGKPMELFPDLFKGLATVRGVQKTPKGQLLLCGHCSVYRIDLDQAGARPVRYSSAGARELVGAAECGDHLYAATLDGKVLRWERGIAGGPDMNLAHLECKTYCVSLVQMPDGPHLALGAKGPALTLVKLAPPYSRAQYLTGGVSIRWARGASDLLVATDGDGLRLFCWSREAVHRPEREIVVGRSPRDQVVDFCILSQ